MGMKLNSTAEAYGKAIDCRCLSLTFEFYELTADRVLALAQQVISWQERFLYGDFVVDRMDYLSRHVSASKAKNQFRQRLKACQNAALAVEAYVKSGVIFDQQSLSEYRLKEAPNRILRDSRDPAKPDRIWAQLFPNGREDDATVLKKIYTVFSLPNQIKEKCYRYPDVFGLLMAMPYGVNNGLFYGQYSFSVSAYSLRNLLNAVAEHFSDFAIQLSASFVKLNARVALQPYSELGRPYELYFSWRRGTDRSHQNTPYTPCEWYPTYYLPGVEWCNIISPLVRQRMGDLTGGKEIEGGGYVICSEKPIGRYDVPDAVALKQLLLPALPDMGGGWPVRSFCAPYIEGAMGMLPRNNWEIVPVLEEEMRIIDGHFYLFRKGSAC